MDSEVKLDLEKDEFSNNDMIDLNNPENNETLTTKTSDQENHPIQSKSQSKIQTNVTQTMLDYIPQENKEQMASNIISNVGSSFQKTWVDKVLCCLNFLRPYFQLNTKELLARLKCSFIPINSQFYELTANKPDLYGPFWIYTTLIFVIAAAGALSNYFGGDNSATGIFDVRVPLVGTIIYIFGFALPLFLYLAFKFVFKNSDLSYIQCLCLYGYSLAVFIPVMLICSIGIEVLQWIFVFYGSLSSTMFVLFNLWKILSAQETKKKYYVIGGIAVVQIGVFLTFKYCLSYKK